MAGYVRPRGDNGIVHTSCLRKESTCSSNCLMRIGGEAGLERLANKVQKTAVGWQSDKQVVGDPNAWLDTNCVIAANHDEYTCSHCAPVIDELKNTLGTRIAYTALGKIGLAVAVVLMAGNLATWAWRRMM